MKRVKVEGTDTERESILVLENNWSVKQIGILAIYFAQLNKKNVPEYWIENGLAGKTWYYKFMNCHNDALSLRKPQEQVFPVSIGTMFLTFLQNSKVWWKESI